MLSFLYFVYGGLLLFNLGYSLVVRKNRTTRLLFTLLLISVITEIVTATTGFEDYFYYACFSPVEYALVSLMLTSYLQRRLINTVVYISIVVFAFVCILLIAGAERSYPSIITAIENVAIIVWCLLSFYFIDPLPDVSILNRSVFWITLGFFIYTLGTFSSNVVYNYWLSTGDNYAKPFHKYVNVFFNLALYVLMAKGLISNTWEEKST